MTQPAGVPFAEFVEAHRDASREEFLEAVGVPHLAVPRGTGAHSRGGYRTEVDLAHAAPRAAGPVKPGADALAGMVLYPIRKRGTSGNIAGQMVMVGRSEVGDIALDDSAVSKFHAYFKLTKPGAWIVCDGGSSYGTFVNGAPAPTTGGLPVASRDRVQFAEGLETVFWSPEDLFAALREVALDGY